MRRRDSVNWYLATLKKYAVFGGRARRKEYWYFLLFNTILSLFLSVIDAIEGYMSGETTFVMFGAIYAVATLVPGL